MHAYEETGMEANAIYRLAVVIEDFPYGLIRVGKDEFTRQLAMSTIPLQVQNWLPCIQAKLSSTLYLE